MPVGPPIQDSGVAAGEGFVGSHMSRVGLWLAWCVATAALVELQESVCLRPAQAA